MRINQNIAALNAWRNLGNTDGALGKSLERLSSGLRINRAADDAAGLAISEKMRGQVRGLNQAISNAQSGISLIQTAEGALTESHAILQRMRELSVQAANDTLTTEDRGEIQKEIDQLVSELDRIADTTEFNTKLLLTGNMGVTVDTAGIVKGIKTTADTQVGTFNVDVTELATAAKVEVIGSGDATQTTTEAAGSFTINVNGRTTVVAWDQNESYKNVAARINANVSGVVAIYDEIENTFTIETADVGAYQNLSVEAAADATFFDGDTLNNTPIEGAGTDAVATGTDAAGNDLTVGFSGNKIMFSGYGSEGLSVEAASVGQVNITIGGALTFQIGANEGQNLSVSMNAMNALNLNVNSIDVTSAHGAGEAISKINDAIDYVSAERSKLGAVQNRLEHTMKNLSVASENLAAAESRIRDVDMAAEIMVYTKNQILSQAGIAMLAQANMRPQSVLQLLG